MVPFLEISVDWQKMCVVVSLVNNTRFCPEVGLNLLINLVRMQQEPHLIRLTVKALIEHRTRQMPDLLAFFLQRLISR